MSSHFPSIALLLVVAAMPLIATAQEVAPADRAVHQSLDEVIVTATPLRTSLLDTAQPVSVLGGDDLRRNASASLGETLAREPGVSSTYYGPIASRPVIRGLSSYRVQMLEDGLASMDVSNVSDDHAVTLEPALARQVEVLRGPAALLFGSGGAGGVVNVVSNRLPDRRPADDFSGTLEARGDTALGERTGVAELNATAGRFTWHADGYLRQTDNVRIAGAAVSDRLRSLLESEGLDVSAANDRVPNSSSESWGAGLSGNYYDDAAAVGVALSRYDTEYGLPSEELAFIRMQRDRADFRARLNFESRFFDAVNVRAGYTDYSHTEFEEPGVAGTVFENRQYEVRSTLDRVTTAGLRSTVGVQSSRQDFDAVGDEAFVPPAVTNVWGVFGVSELDIGRWTLEAGVRVDNQQIDPANTAERASYDANAVSVSLGSLWRFAESQALAINLTSTQRHPQSTELYADGAHAALQRVEIGDESLRKETGYTVDLALRRVDSRISWSAGVFANQYSDYVYISPTGTIDATEDLPVYAYQQADADLYGLEGELSGSVSWVSNGSLSARLFGDLLRGKLRQSGANLPAIPPYRLGLGLDYDVAAWHAGLTLVYHAAQDRVAVAELPTGAFLMLDIDTSYNIDLANSQLKIYLRGTNLLDEEARVHASALKDIAPLAGRSLRLGVRLEFGN